MKKQKKWILVLATITVFMATALFLPGPVGAGNLDPSESPDSTMHTLEEIYEKLGDINSKLEPLPCEGAPVEKTGQTTSYETGDDGDLQKGVAWPDPRFTDNPDGTVTDNLTGLIWLKNANCFSTRTWDQALSDCNSLAEGSCGLTDGSVAGDWRLPNLRELESLIDYGKESPALPDGHPFTDVQSSYYWSSTTLVNDAGVAWFVYFGNGFVNGDAKSSSIYVWCVRGGQ